MNNLKNFFLEEKNFINYIVLYVFLIPWNFFNAQMGLLSAILLIWWLFLTKKYHYHKKLSLIFTLKPLFLFVLFIAWSFLSLLWTDDYYWEKISLKYYKYYFFMIPVFITVLNEKTILKVLYSLVVSIGVYSLFSIGIYFNFYHIPHSSHADPRGILAYAVVTPYMAFGVFASLFIALKEKTNLRHLFYLFTLTSFIALFINNGRAGQLAFFVTVILFLFLQLRHLKLKYILSGVVVIVLSISALHYTGKTQRFTRGFSELQKTIQTKEFDGSWGFRAYMWYAAYNLFPKHPFIGAGAGDHIDEFIEFTKTHPSKATWLRSYHNQHLDFLMKYGLIGYTLFISSIILLLYKLKEDKFYFPIALSFFSITLVDGIADIILLMKPYTYVFMILFLLFNIKISKRSMSV